MAECLYYLNESGEAVEVQNLPKEGIPDKIVLIGNEVSLDGYLYDHRDELLINLGEVELDYSLPLDSTQDQTISYLTNEMVQEAEKYARGSKKYDITSVWEQINPDNFELSTSSYDDYRRKQIVEGLREEMHDFDEMPEIVRERLIKERLAKPNPINYTKIGDITSKWINEAIKHGEDGLKSLTKDLSVYDDIIKSEEFYRTLQAVALDVARLLKAKFSGAKFLFELPLATTNITHDFRSLLNTVAGRSDDHIEALFGRVDITAIMPNGSVATIELKTSGRKLPEDVSDSSFGSKSVYHPFTFRKYSAQVISYDIIRKQNGVRSTPYLLNVHRMENGGVKLDKLMEIPTSDVSGTFASIIKNGIPIQERFEIKTVDKVNKLMSDIFGDGSAISREIREIERDIAFFLDPDNKIVKDVDDTMPEAQKAGYTHYFRNTITKEKVFASSEADLRTKLEDYLLELDKISKSALITISKAFNKMKSLEELRDLLINNGYPKSAADTAVMKLGKYVNNKWILNDSPALIANGCLLFQGYGRSEMVMLEEITSLKEMHEFPNVKKGTTILGKLYGDSEQGASQKNILKAHYGNLMIMKGMAIVAEYPELFKNAPISNISAMNIRRGETFDNVMNSIILTNWKLLSAKFRSLGLKQVDGCFMSDTDACVNRARDMIAMCEGHTVANRSGAPIGVKFSTNFKIFTMAPETSSYTYDQLVAMWNELEGKYGSYSDEMSWELKRAYTELNKAILASRGFYIQNEEDVALYLDKGFAITGGYMTPFYRSTSHNQRLIAEISGVFHYKLHEICQQLITPFQVKLNKVLEKNENYITGVTSEYVVSADWFITKNMDGTPCFRFKPLTDPYFKNRDDERELLEYVLDTFAKLRWPKRDVSYMKADPNSKYYDAPMFESGWIETAWTSDEKIKSLLSLGKRKGKRLVNKAADIVQGSEQDIAGAQDENVLDQKEVPSPFWEGNRNEKLTQYGPDIFTKNIDDIFLYTIIASVKSNLSRELLPLFTSVRHLIKYENKENKAGMNEIETAIKQFIGTVIFDKSGVATNLLSYQKVLQIFRQMFSIATLGLNPRALVRDTLSSNLRTATVLLTGGKDSLGIKSDDYFTAYFEMVKDGSSLFTSAGFNNQLNLIHKMANMSYREIHDQLKTNKFALANLDSQFLFMTTTSSDFIHRMALLKCYMKELGCDKAYVKDPDGVVRYYMDKDIRWNLLFKYRTGDKFSINDRARVPANEQEEYVKQWTAYVESIRNWRKNTKIEIGEELPKGLDPIQENNIKALANNLYGAYDKEEQALVHQTLLGGAFFQFKTYGISRLMDWWKSAGQINIIRNEQLTDSNGKKLYERLTTPEEFAETGETTKIVDESEVTTEDIIKGRVQPLRAEFSGIDEGRLQSTYALMAAAYGAYYKGNKELEAELNRMMKDPLIRSNIARAMLDIFLSLIIQGFVRIVYPEEALQNMSDQDWWTRWTYAIITGVAQDGPIWEIVKSVWGGGEIPAISGMSRWFTSAMGVINGDHLLPALFNTFGATRELTSMLDNL